MDYFCQQCSAKPGWPWDEEKAFQWSCQRCFRNLPCNDYGWRKPKVNQSAAPRPKDLVATQINSHAQVDLPRAKGTPIAPIPVVVVEEIAVAKVSDLLPVDPPGIPQEDTLSEADKAIAATQPNRPKGIQMQVTKKSAGKFEG